MTNKTSLSTRLAAIGLRLLALCIMHCAFCIPLSASAVSIEATAAPNIGAGDPTPIEATVSGGTVDHLYLVYQIVGSTHPWNTNEMTSASATVYTNAIPPLSGSVTVEWYVTDGIVSSATKTTTLAALPDYNRYHDGVQYNATTAPYGWQQVSGSNYVAQAPNGTQWKASGVAIATGSRNFNGASLDAPSDFPSLYFYNLPLSENPHIRSPKIFGGVGTIDIRTKLAVTTITESEITLQVAYTDDEPTENDWNTIKVYKFGTRNGNVFSQICHEVLNDYGITYIRIVRTQPNIDGRNPLDGNWVLTNGRLAIDNICITKPAADVGIIEKLKNPGYPSADQDILMRCAVTNVCEDTPAVNRRVSVKYQHVARDTASPVASAYAWLSADMTYMGKDANGLDWYEGTIPTQKVGYVWYYYQVDYDGYHYGDNPLTGASESISPAYWDAGVDTHDRPTSGAKFQVRPYRSRYGRISLVGQTQDVSIPEMTLVDNEQWQTVVPVSGYTVVSNYFLGYGYYADDAEAYESTPVIWGENNPDALSDPTRAGFLESSHDTSVTNQLVALNEKNYTGFYLYRFSSNDEDVAEGAAGTDEDRRYDYIVKKAVYQDFDEWTASPDYYESSLGGLPTLTFTEDFDGNAASSASGAICVETPWAPDVYYPADFKDEDFDAPDHTENEPSDEFANTAVKTVMKFIRTGSRILQDRKEKNTDTKVNKAMALKEGGQIENTKDSIPYGLEKIVFKARASVDDRNFAVFKDGSQWNTFPKYVSATWQLTELAPSKPYFSYVLLYQPPTWGGASWYEVRIVQADSYNANNDTVNIEVWRHKSDGTETKIGSRNNITGRNLKTSHTVNVLVDKNGNKLRFRAHLTGGNPSSVDRNDRANSAYIEDSSPINFTDGGAIGFGVFDAVPNITMVKAGTTNGGTDIISSLPNTYSNWYDGGQRPDGQPRWTITSGSIVRTVPTQTIGLYAAKCVGSESRAEIDELPSTPTFTRTVNTLTMTPFSIDFKAWNKTFVQIRYEDGDGGIVLDNIKYHPWRAVTRYDAKTASTDKDYFDWTSTEAQEQWLDFPVNTTTGETMRDHWAVMEGWVTNSGAFKMGVQLERSRANTNLVQGVVSPALTNGMGSCSFSYTVTGGKVVYGVERTARGNYHEWIPVMVYTNFPGDSGERYAKIGLNFGDKKGGRIRVRIYGSPNDVADLLEKNPDCGYDPAWGLTAANAKLLVDNLRVKDYPEDNGNAWNAYNLLITENAPDGQIYNNTGKSCFFNNSPTNGVYGAEEFNDSDPYLESPPLIGVGVGEIAFQYRIVEDGTAPENTDGHLVIMVAPRRDTPLAEWKTITNLLVSANGTAFVKFDNEKIFDERNFVVRFYNSKLPGTPRFVIDNVLVTAPARPSFEFEYVHLLPEQPLAGTNTAVEAKIMREIMNPKNVRVFVSWHQYDTNNVNDAWGVNNWFKSRDGASQRELVYVGEKLYRTPVGSGIPAFAANDLVEFVVWGVHDDIHTENGDSPIFQGEETFKMPEWYRTVNRDYATFVPMDINGTNVMHGRTILWENTINPNGGWSPYFWVFSCPPGSFFVNEINNWYASGTATDFGSAEYVEFAGYAGTDLGGWKLAIVNNGDCDDMEYVIPANTRIRSNGPSGWGFFIWGDSCSSDTFTIDEGGDYDRVNTPFDVDAAFEDSSDPEDRHIGNYAGIIIYRPNGMVEEMVRFGRNSGFDGEEHLWVYAGRKDSDSVNSLSRISPVVDEESGERRAGRVASDFVWNTEAGIITDQTPVEGNGRRQIFAEIGADVPVVVALYDPEGNEITDEDVLDWIAKYGGEQSDIDALGTMDKFTEEFLLALDLTKTCVAELKITSIRIEDGYVYLGVLLTRTEDGTPVGTRKINGTLKLLGRADLTTGAFAPLEADCDDRFELGNSTEAEYELPASNPPKFFKVVIE